jgi:hypothetical protein
MRHRNTLRFLYKKISRLMLFMKIITVYFEGHSKHTNTLCGGMKSLHFLKQVLYAGNTGL